MFSIGLHILYNIPIKTWYCFSIMLPSRSGKNILTDFIGKEVLGSELFFVTSDLGKVLGRFNSCIQARKLILLNKAEMASGEWHKANDHLKSLITEPYVTIECKGLEPKTIKDFARY